MIRIVHEELINYGNTLDSDKEKLAAEIENIRKINDRLRAVWKGVDANAFCYNLGHYADKMESIVASMDNLSGYTRKVNQMFNEIDEHYASKLRHARSRYKTS